MKTFIEKILEFEKIKISLSSFAKIQKTKDKILGMHKIDNYSDITKSIDEVDEAYKNINLAGMPSFLPIDDILEPLSHLRVLSSLDIKEIYNISKVITVSKNLIDYHIKLNHDNLKNIHDDIHKQLLSTYTNKLSDLSSLNSEIKKVISDDLDINDNASAKLSSIRKKIKSIQSKIDSASNKVLEKYADKLNDTVLSLKNGKLCLQVKSEFSNQIDGVVHDVSGTKTTIFIEPKELTIISNEENELKGLEKIEINKILKKLSNQLIPYVDTLISNYENIINLDFIYAKANYAKHNNQTKPILNNDGYINLIKAIHPLLDKDTAVPLDISIGKEYKTLIITGPNTGGKTVALKTVGLLSLMALSGMFINAFENSIISNFDEIFADIGDEQSIEQNLSTFSSHMKNIIYITINATPKSLILFDELCTGTDPIEGANLAMSIITTLKNRNCRILATTHYPELKLYALSQKGVVNGSFEFDVETLKPTYRLLIGLPGKSNAFLISEKLGLDKNIILNAKNHIKENDKKFEDIVSSLQNKETHIDKEKKEIELLKQEIISLKQKVERQQKGLNDREESIIRQAKEKASSILMEARNTANETIKHMKEEGATLDGSIKERTKINKMLSDISSSLMTKTKGPSKPISPKNIRIGQKVKIMSMGLEGTVETLPDKDYNLFIRVGLVRITAKLNDLELIDTANISIENAKVKNIYSHNAQHIKIEKSTDTPMELNVIGKDKEEALFMLDKYLDDCLLGHLKTCRIIHGKGAGILKNAIHNYLHKLDYIEEYHLADFRDGGAGATIITFK